MSKTQKYSADVLISGGGIAGLTLAALLGQSGVRVHIIEPAPPQPLNETERSSRTIALMQSSLNVLKAVNLEEFCTQHGTKMEVMRLIDDSIIGQDPITSEFDSFDIGQAFFSMNIPNSVLRAKLYEDVTAMDSVTVHAPAKLVDYLVRDGHHVEAKLDNGSEIHAPLIVGADGRQSLVRKLAGIKSTKKQYDQSAITCLINHSRAHNNTSTEFHRSGGPFALVPLQGNQSSVVWVEKTDQADALMKLPKDAFEAALQKATNDLLGGVTLETNPQSWPLCAIKAKTLTAPRTALIAEAAHVMSPITAQGLNLSLRDVAALAETIIDTMRVGVDHGSKEALRTYERRRHFDIETRTFGVNGMNEIVSKKSTAIKDLRRMGLKTIDRFSPLKMLAMQHGLAPSLDPGRLVQGEPL